MTYEFVSFAGMGVLLGWGSANMIVGIKNRNSLRPRHKAFWRMNFAWGVINALIAGIALRTLILNEPRLTDRSYQINQINLVAFNAFLDVLYVAIGIIVYRYGTRKSSLTAQGFGAAVAVQGVFLLLLDIVLVLLLRMAMN